MQMNNMGMMGMNNQQNLMDQTALNIKNIIQPYENKISELEEIIKQKDFEITVLKQKLNNSINSSKNNLMNLNPNQMMNMNPMMNMNLNNQMMDMMNPSFNNRERIFVKIKSNINTTIECYKDDRATSIEKKLTLTYNYEPIYEKTLGEYGISNNSIINIADKIYNVHFKAISGLNKVLILDGDCPLKEAIKLYFRRLNRENIYEELLNNQKHLFFIYGSIILSIRDERPLNIILSYPNPVITVNDTDNIIGGKSKE
jgi:hypothetical protein